MSVLLQLMLCRTANVMQLHVLTHCPTAITSTASKSLFLQPRTPTSCTMSCSSGQPSQEQMEEGTCRSTCMHVLTPGHAICSIGRQAVNTINPPWTSIITVGLLHA
jgi:hypothetical protein